MTMINQYVKNYAQALFSLCHEESVNISDVSGELLAVNEVFENNSEFLQLLYSPTVNCSEKTEMLKAVFTGMLSDSVLDFLCVIVENSRIQDYSAICAEFKSLYYNDADLLEVTVTTTVALSDRLRDKLVQKLEKMTGKHILLVEKTDAQLIGGIVIDYNDTQIDGSIKRKLYELKKSVDSVIA